jgi:hypothetical protein
MHLRTGIRLAAAALTFAAASSLEAQAWNYPSFQAPRVTSRELNFAVADGGDAGTGLVFQWREGLSSRTQLSLDAGYAEPDYPDWLEYDGYFLIGGQFARQLTRASADMPLDVMLTAGVNVAIGDPFNLVRVPVGVAAGHRFQLERGMAITPYGHLRLSYDRVSMEGASESEMNPNFDLGGSFEFNPRLAVRLSATLGDDDAFGASLAWTPRRAGSATPPTRQRPRR